MVGRPVEVAVGCLDWWVGVIVFYLIKLSQLRNLDKMGG